MTCMLEFIIAIFIRMTVEVLEWWEDGPEFASLEAAEPVKQAYKYTPLVRLYTLFLLMLLM